jgi:hypothetical protein
MLTETRPSESALVRTRNTGISGTAMAFTSSNLPKYEETEFLSNNTNDSLNNINNLHTTNIHPTPQLAGTTLQVIAILVLLVVSGRKRGRS